jgi:hypothetical protein
MAAAKKVAAAKAAPKAAPAPEATPPAAAPAPAPEATPRAAAPDVADQNLGAEDQNETIRPAEGEVFVLAAKGLERFHRCGMRFTREPSVLVVADLAEGVLERLREEPNLIVVEG